MRSGRVQALALGVVAASQTASFIDSASHAPSGSASARSPAPRGTPAAWPGAAGPDLRALGLLLLHVQAVLATQQDGLRKPVKNGTE